jgi:hypothetical protein
MPLQGSRELSQFGSFLYIDDSTRTIGIATTSSSNIGFGTANPQYKVHVVGNTNIDGNFYLNGVSIVSAGTERWSSGSGSDIYRLSGDVGIGTDNPTSKFQVFGDADIRGTLYADFISLDNAFTLTTADSYSISIRSGGLLNYCGYSLGRTSAEGTLSVSGGAGQFSTDSIAGDIVLRTESTSSKLLFNNGSSDATLAISNNIALIGTIIPTGTANQRFQVESGAYIQGSLGIGNTNPGATLDVAGDVRLSSSDPEIEFNSGGSRLKGSTNSLSVHSGGGLNSTASEIVRFTSTGVGIGTTIPTQSLQVGPGLTNGQIFVATQTGSVGVGTSVPRSKLQVIGDVSVSGIITATRFSGNGAGLSSVTSFLGIRTDTTANIGAGASIVAFVGTGVSSVSVGSGIATVVIKYADTTGLVSKSGDIMSGQLGVTLGTASLPSVYFNGYPSTGFYAPGANRFGVSANGSLILDVKSTGIVVTGGISTSSGTSSQFLKADGSIDSTTYASVGRSIAMSIVFG